MPRHSPFTALCQTVARPPRADRADLHVHSTWSDGLYTPAELVDQACRAGLAGLAITDHDTLDALPEARTAAQGRPLEIIPAVEITAEFLGHETHLLAYFVDPNFVPLLEALARIRVGRIARFRAMFDHLRTAGLPLREEDIPVAPRETLGRPHLARMLVQVGCVASVREAFQRYLTREGINRVPKPLLPTREATDLVHQAGGVISLAHPSRDLTLDHLRQLHSLGVQAVEVEYPDFKTRRTRELRSWASALGLAVTGGSDCHGPGPRAVGSHTISRAEMEALRPRR